MISLHLPTELFDRLAATGGGPAAVDLLRRARQSRTLLAIRYVVDNHSDVHDLMATLAAAQAMAPRRVATVLTYPWVSVWIAQALRDGWTARDQQRLAAVVTAASLRARLAQPMPPLLVPDCGRIVLPTLGVLAASDPAPRRVTPAELDGPRWARLRTVSSEDRQPRPTMTVDDLDPYRDCHGFPVADRVDDRTWNAWRNALRGAWYLLARYAPDRYDEVAVGLSSAVPLRTAPAGGDVSATHQEAFGGFAASLPSSPAELAATMVHELQHSKLHAITTLVKLHDSDHRQAFFAPWRPDPRPLFGALHGAYAFTAVAGLWHALRADPALERIATLRFATTRAEVNRLLPDLLAAPGLTQSGRRFAGSLATTVADMSRHDVPRRVDRLAVRRLNLLERRWRERNGLSS